ncbi:hypothetical protein J2S74_003213 [Evansella vedderi]|uniref:Uncharacterized protein n=1 Tax=Evansella vedderi TaxID=38282 RepID=A0ABT9ZX80_9BACI|nr:hypothetical protein [Evansella vedderi]MDQ0255831.1 hypothetical protein [Evansella vedderi]
MKKIVIVSSKDRNAVYAQLPKHLRSIPFVPFNLGPSGGDSESSPFSWDSISNLFMSYDHIIIFYPLYSNDQLHQGKEKHLWELLLLLFWKGALTYRKTLSLYKNKSIIPLEGSFPLDTEFWTEQKEDLTKAGKSLKSVTSIQKIPISKDYSAEKWASIYFRWLHTFTKKVITIKDYGSVFPFRVVGAPPPLLVLKKNDSIKEKDICEFVIQGGFLNKESSSEKPLGRFWFVVSPDKKFLYTALIHFKPALPWFVYLLSQGWIHGLVMKRFGSYVLKLSNR